MTQSELPTIGDFKVFIIGPSGVGKTTFIQKHATGDFFSEYTPTMTPQTTPISFRMMGEDVDGIVYLNVSDCVYGDSWSEADAAIFMFDIYNGSTFSPAMSAYTLFQILHPSKPAIFVGTKSDIGTEDFSNVSLLSSNGYHGGEYAISEPPTYAISSKSAFNYEMPFLYLIRQLVDETLDFEEMSVYNPPTVIISPHIESQLLQELEHASAIPLPDLSDIEENDLSSLSELESPTENDQWSMGSIPSLDFGFSSCDEFD